MLNVVNKTNKGGIPKLCSVDSEKDYSINRRSDLLSDTGILRLGISTYEHLASAFTLFES